MSQQCAKIDVTALRPFTPDMRDGFSRIDQRAVQVEEDGIGLDFDWACQDRAVTRTFS